MSNYIIINKASNLIIDVVATSYTPIDSSIKRFIRVSDAVLDKYYKLANSRTRDGKLVDAGELAKVSPSFKELLAGKSPNMLNP